MPAAALAAAKTGLAPLGPGGATILLLSVAVLGALAYFNAASARARASAGG